MHAAAWGGVLTVITADTARTVIRIFGVLREPFLGAKYPRSFSRLTWGRVRRRGWWIGVRAPDG